MKFCLWTHQRPAARHLRKLTLILLLRRARILGEWVTNKDSMKMKSRKRYSTEFKAKALELVAFGKRVAKAVEDLSIRTDII